MKLFNRGALQTLLVAALLLAGICAAVPAYAAGSRDVLWNILNTCINPDLPDYSSICRAPRIETPCAIGKSCQETSEVWAETGAYVALRDRKMCGCPDDFVHGIVLPRAKVTGVEDPRRPDGIWSFAWAVACSKIGSDASIALAVNPAGMRDQDQLHVHIVRMQKDARLRFRAEQLGKVGNLEEVWGVASRIAGAAGLADYGILVARHPEGGFTVLVDKVSLEKSYGIARCR
jgi:CDP-diacylglycerol pyrophosphatase